MAVERMAAMGLAIFFPAISGELSWPCSQRPKLVSFGEALESILMDPVITTGST